MPRAWADDLALIEERVADALPILVTFFVELERATGLSLNPSKTVLVPLTMGDWGWFRTCLNAAAPRWLCMQVAGAAKYLGVYVGPAKGRLAWTAPLRKYVSRCQYWGRSGAGLCASLRVYQVYAASVLS